MAIRRSAAAKINLCLHVVGQRADGLHDLQSAVAFLECGEWVELRKSERTELNILGPKAAELPVQDDNLILKAAALFPSHCQTEISLHKTMPVAFWHWRGQRRCGSDTACDGRAMGSASA
jgi:4-diphosphocytidyl-2-C-methyl-D-erythritol kinase